MNIKPNGEVGMKKLLSFALSIVLALGIIGCGGTGGAASVPTETWQEKYDLGIRYLSEGNYREAILAFEAAIQIDPKQADAYLSLAQAYEAMGNAETARGVLTDGVAACGETAELTAALDALTPSAAFAEDHVLLVGEELAGCVTYGEMPAMFAAAFDGLEEYLPVEKKHPGNFFDEYTVPYYIQGREVPCLQRDCDYQLTLPDADYRDRVVGQQMVTTGELIGIDIDLSRRETPARDISIGFRNISMGDDYAAVVEKLGLPKGLAEHQSIQLGVNEDGTEYLNAFRSSGLQYNRQEVPEIQISYERGRETVWSISFRFVGGACLTEVTCTNLGALAKAAG